MHRRQSEGHSHKGKWLIPVSEDVKVCVPLIKILVTQVTPLQLSCSDAFKHVSVACYSTSTKLRLCSDVTLNTM
jgi:hypothetical protein